MATVPVHRTFAPILKKIIGPLHAMAYSTVLTPPAFEKATFQKTLSQCKVCPRWPVADFVLPRLPLTQYDFIFLSPCLLFFASTMHQSYRPPRPGKWVVQNSGTICEAICCSTPPSYKCPLSYSSGMWERVRGWSSNLVLFVGQAWRKRE
jgi:hypothetical protein